MYRYTKSKCVSITRFKEAIRETEQYIIYQKTIGANFRLADTIADCGQPTGENICKWKKVIREGVPD